ncbi:hypothetical protein [Phorcysia thermohydrogeniphila]|uniref:Uncharacterized protein n=1 Tax=Phorcysia thermohydrogeniphila TaxID=936138 RepID=A0A4R1GDP2_9BACT|nr:hypothetical protein [Phorcysia thermohydrogeniphila]TCK06467.1 hypothetical protein CLV27_0268 [Phorcysia thermohydrogeniphila]
MGKFFLSLIFVALSLYPVYGSEFKILTEATSVRSAPNGEIVGTLGRGEVQTLYGKFSFWGKGENGWVNLDFTEVNLPEFTVTGELRLRLVETGEVEAVTEEGTLHLLQGSVVVVSEEDDNFIYGVYKGKPLALDKKELDSQPEERQFQIAVLNREARLISSTGRTLTLKPGTVVLVDELSGEVLFSGELWERIEFPDTQSEPQIDAILEEVNHLVDIFNSAKYSSPIAERLGYYVKLLPVEEGDIELVPTGDGYGLKIALRYQLFYKSGKPIKTRKTRLIFKKSNFEFWRKVTEVCFNYGINRFVELDILRYNGEDFSKEGFVAASFNVFKLGYLSTTKGFMDNAESELSEDLWFFADEVYERLEDDDSEER